MIHRSRRHLATLPARRGMRAHWLRCRIPDEMDAAAEAATAQTAPPAAEPVEHEAVPADPAPGASTKPSAVRPAFGHPTF